MNKVILIGRLTKDPELRYSQGTEPIAVARYTLAVARRFKRQGEPEADFINCIAFGKSGEFAQKYFKKGLMVAIAGRLQVSQWEDKNGTKRWSTDIVVEEQNFTGSKAEGEKQTGQAQPKKEQESKGFYPIDEGVDNEDLPF